MLGAVFLAVILSGTVIDGRTMLPVGGARVEVQSKGHPTVVATTGEDGRFTVNAPDSSATISATKPEFFPDLRGSYSGVLLVNAGQSDVIVILQNHHWVYEGVKARPLCSAFQPREVVDRYIIMPGSCGRGRALTH